MNYLDTRDLAKRKDELEDLRTALADAREALDDHKTKDRPEDDDEQDAFDEERDELEDAVSSAESEFGDDEVEELKALEELESEVSEWTDGNTLIPESEFEDYARQTAEDIGAIPDNAQWPCTCINWKEAADELRQDYSEVEFQGTTYLVRA